jgi:hypothetical protein
MKFDKKCIKIYRPDGKIKEDSKSKAPISKFLLKEDANVVVDNTFSPLEWNDKANDFNIYQAITHAQAEVENKNEVSDAEIENKYKGMKSSQEIKQL